MNVFTKDPEAVIDFTHDWASDYLEDDETLVASVWSVEPYDLILVGGTHTDANTTVSVAWGSVGRLYRVANEVETSAGRTEVRSIGVRVQHR